MRFVLLIALFVLFASASRAVVIRDDVDDAQYRLPAADFPALVDLPGEGHGVLIAPAWVVTAAHAVTWQPAIRQVLLNGKARNVARVVLHPGYRRPDPQVLQHALSTWDWTLFVLQLAASDDIALLELAEPVEDVVPVALHTTGHEVGTVVELIGKGATGTGAAGYAHESSHRTALRRAHNRVTSADGRWFCYVFDRPGQALPLEGGSGAGDSGGPLLVQEGADRRLLGLTSWVAPQGTVKTAQGLYGQVSCNVRLRHYLGWIGATIQAQ